MKPENSMLSITLHIPVTEDVNVEDVLDALRDQLKEAMEVVRQQVKMASGTSDEEDEAGNEIVFKASIEKTEPLTEDMAEDRLSMLGYKN